MAFVETMQHWLEDLNPPQREAATYGEGPLLVIAGAGTGKTKTLAARVAFLVQGGLSPDRILLLTFARRAAAEMISRAERMCGQTMAGRVWGGTFHAVANRLLRHFGRTIGLSPEFTVMDEADAADLMNLLRSELGHGGADHRFARKQTLAQIYSRAVNASEKLEEVLKRHFPWCQDNEEGIREIFRAYIERKKQRNLLDYDDLLLFWRALTEAPGIGDQIGGRFEHVLVDEYQDTNVIQADILAGMRRQKRNVMVVGDDAQSIYSFRAATVRNILEFPERFPGARTVTLEQNYRSVTPILDVANRVMSQADSRYAKTLWSNRRSTRRPRLIACMDEQQQTMEACRNILARLEEGVPLRRQAVLFRAGYHSDVLEVELTRRRIPFHKYGGLRFIETAHIKDVLAFMRVLENPTDEVSWFRLLQLLEGIGPKTARRIINAILSGANGEASPSDGEMDVAAADAWESDDQEWEDVGLKSISEPLTRFISGKIAVSGAAIAVLAPLREVLADCLGIGEEKEGEGRRNRRGRRAASSKDRAPAALAEDVGLDAKAKRREEPALSAQIERIRRFYQPIFERVYDNAVVRGRDLEQLEVIAAGYRSRTKFITDLTLDPPSSTSDLAADPSLEEDYLILSTIHSAKGCEWDVVHILHVADGMIPSDMAVRDEEGVEEERRLFYVAITRARDRLYLYFPLRYYHSRFGKGDAHGYAQISRFITRDVAALLDSAPGVGSSDAREASGKEFELRDPRDSLSRLW